MRPASVLSPVERWMLPGELSRLLETAPARRPTPRRTVRDWVVDSLAFGVGVTVWATELQNTFVDNIYELPEVLRVLDPVVGALLCVALWWRRRFPLALGIAAVVGGAVSNTGGGAILCLLFSLALHRGWLQAALVVVLGTPLGLPQILLFYPNAGEDPATIAAIVVLATVVVIAIGLAVRSRRQLVLVLRVRAEEQRLEYERKLEDSRRDERRRIAREMHDTLAHRISLLTVHAGALEYRTEAAERGEAAPLSAAEVHAAVGVMREAAHAAVDELREVLHLLRSPGEGENAGAEPPQPGVDRIAGLVEEARAGGQRVRESIDGDPAALRSPVQRTVYRLVQEGLTNARKHAPGATVSVDVHERDGGVLVEVGNAVTPGVTTAAGAGAGLTGLAERVALHSGTLTHEIRDGRFVLRAEIPGGGT